ncbi:glycosyl transferase group 1 [Paludibacter propionicigenes WB4]|uniref:Glycosyl transferase group 1 n=2 Tax=Paludibacter TaxID=346096 RepID=E4T312_PALPW|nr:glycosyl transferase group 1 [Paludibacter propionicigenes WB4]
MNVLFLTIALPDLNNSSNMYGDLIQEYIKQGHKVYTVAPTAKEKTHISVENKVEVLRVKTLTLFGVGNVKKGIAYQMLIPQYLLAIKKYFSNIHVDLIICHTPPLEFALIMQVLKKKFKCSFYLLLRDYIWQDAVGLGIIKEKGIICRYYRYLEKKMYQLADGIGCMSQGNIEFVKYYYPDLNAAKLHILDNFQSPQVKVEKDDDLRTKYELKGKFVSVYGGNMGVSQKMENILALAQACMEYNDVIFLLIGNGTSFKKLKIRAQQIQLTNIKFYDFIPRDEYQKLMAQCNLGLISLNENLKIPNIPSKTISYFNMSIPILASIDYVTDYGELLESTNSGLWSYGGDLKTLKANFDKLYHSQDLRDEMGENGYHYYCKNMTAEYAYHKIMDFLNK